MPYLVHFYLGCLCSCSTPQSPDGSSPSLLGGNIWENWERDRTQSSALSSFLFFFLRNFFPPTADDFTILGGGVEILAFAPPTLQVPDKALHSSRSQRASEFPKDEVAWRLLPSQLPLPLPQSPALSPAREAPPGWEETPAHSSSNCHAAEIKDTSLSWAPANRFKLSSGRGGPELQLHATCKGSLGPTAAYN